MWFHQLVLLASWLPVVRAFIRIVVWETQVRFPIVSFFSDLLHSLLMHVTYSETSFLRHYCTFSEHNNFRNITLVRKWLNAWCFFQHRLHASYEIIISLVINISSVCLLATGDYLSFKCTVKKAVTMEMELTRPGASIPFPVKVVLLQHRCFVQNGVNIFREDG